QLELGLASRAAAILLDQPRVRELVLRVLVERLQIRMRGRRIEVVVELLHVLAVVALVAGEPEEALLQDRVASVPEREREAQPALAGGDPAEPVLPPPVRAAGGVVVRQVSPGGPASRVVLAHGAPLPLGEVRSPALPVEDAPGVLVEAPSLGIDAGWLASGHAQVPEGRGSVIPPSSGMTGR